MPSELSAIQTLSLIRVVYKEMAVTGSIEAFSVRGYETTGRTPLVDQDEQ